MSSIEDIVSTLDQEYLPKETQDPDLLAELLADLGYLRNFDGQASSVTSDELKAAMQNFEDDLNSSDVLPTKEISQIKEIYGDQSQELLLKLCLDIDEGIELKALPRFGDRGLAVRIIHYRLQLLGLYSNPIDAYYNASSYSGLSKASSYTGKTLLRTINLIADIQHFTVKYLEHKGYESPVTVLQVNPEALRQLSSPLPDYSGVFKRAVKRELKNHEEVFDELKKDLFRRDDDKVDLPEALQMSSNPDNSFVIRLIQIHQWMAGFYHGKLDGDVGAVTLQSLTQIIDCYKSSGEDIDEKRALVTLVNEHGIIAFNTIYFLNRYKQEHTQSDKTIETLETLNSSYQSANSAQQETFSNQFNQKVAQIKERQEPSHQEQKGFLARVFGGMKGFFKKIFRFAGKLFNWIVKAVKKLSAFIVNFIKKIYEIIKQAAIHFIEGVKFLLGRTEVLSSDNSGNILSQFDVDKDVFNYAYQLNENLLKEHKGKVNEKVQSLKFSLMLIALLFKTVKAIWLGAIAWPIFLFKLAKSFKQLIDQYKAIQTI